MKRQGALDFILETRHLKLISCEAPWDSAVFSVPVAQINKFEVTNYRVASEDYVQYQSWVSDNQIGIVSCRLSEDRLHESMLLEKNGFRFVEMVLHPQLTKLQRQIIDEDDLQILPVIEADLEELRAIAECSFTNERYHVDPRIDSRLADVRYGRWVSNSLKHGMQRLLKILEGDRLIGFFLIEATTNKSIYWHLTAVAPQWQGRGYGKRIWRAMLRQHQIEGFDTVTTTISARNIRVLNLYARLGFQFLPLEMTFHWIRDSD